jgi:hypothetical protein
LWHDGSSTLVEVYSGPMLTEELRRGYVMMSGDKYTKFSRKNQFIMDGFIILHAISFEFSTLNKAVFFNFDFLILN